MLELVSFDELRYSAIGGKTGLKYSDYTSYPRLEKVKDIVYYAIENYTQRKLEYATYEANIFDRCNSKMIKLDAIPIDNITVTDVENSSEMELDFEYEITHYGIRILNGYTGKLLINYTGGYTVANVPDEIKRAAYYQIQSEYLKRDTIDGEYINNSGGTIRRPPIQLLKMVKELLNPFRHPLYRGY